MRLLVQADLDNELDAAGAAALAAHLEGCEGCAALRDDLARVSGALRAGLTRRPASPALRDAIQALLPRPVRAEPPWRGLGSFGAGLALAASVAMVALLPHHSGPGDGLVDAHIRALQPGHLIDVESSDKHTVKPWFDGKIDFAPPVADFAAQGYPLVGGRLDYVDGRAVAVLVYRRDKHLIDVFIWPGDQKAHNWTAQGYNVEAWSSGGMNFRAVSDLNVTELSELRRLASGQG